MCLFGCVHANVVVVVVVVVVIVIIVILVILVVVLSKNMVVDCVVDVDVCITTDA